MASKKKGHLQVFAIVDLGKPKLWTQPYLARFFFHVVSGPALLISHVSSLRHFLVAARQFASIQVASIS
jgi:hypothetical protein